MIMIISNLCAENLKNPGISRDLEEIQTILDSNRLRIEISWLSSCGAQDPYLCNFNAPI